ncbi:MAG TPA: hypothetical protein VIK10_11650 [Prolixibacteraceae bacterium]
MCLRSLKTGLISCFIFLTLGGSAIERATVIGAREAALAMTVVSVPGSFSVFHNQALLADFRTISAGVSIRQPFFIKGYNESALSFVLPARDIVFAFCITHTAIATYSESAVGLAISKKLTRNLSAGLLFDYFTFNLPESGRNKGSFQLDGGLAYKFSEILSLGLHVRNVFSTQATTFQNQVTFPMLFRVGASYCLTEKIMLLTEMVSEKHAGLNFRFGTEYSLQGNFFLRGGISTRPFQHSAGFGYRWSACQLDFALVHHEILGYTPIFSLTYNFTSAYLHR